VNVDGVRLPPGRTLCRVCRVTMLPADRVPDVCRWCASHFRHAVVAMPDGSFLDPVMDERNVLRNTAR